MIQARVKRLLINPEAFFAIMQTGTAWKVTKGIPENAVFKGITTDPITQNINIFVEHESFDLVNIETEVSPVMETLFKKLQ